MPKMLQRLRLDLDPKCFFEMACIKNPPDKGFDRLIFEVNKFLPQQDQKDVQPTNIYKKIVDIALCGTLFFHFVFWLLFRAYIFSSPG